jgi:hypothetical protein
MDLRATAQLIEKESIPQLSFLHSKAINQANDLLDQISKATQLGNSQKGKVSIFFECDQGLKRVETAIWAAGSKFICLKGAVWIPIANVVEIRF